MATRSKAKAKVADLYCGGGGSSSGVREACQELGLSLELIAVNHWEIAIKTHSANHPYATHYCQSVDDTDPLQVVHGGRLRLLWASPECIWHSRARGGKPVNDQKRMSPFKILDWVTRLYIDNVIIENVREFRDWGPLIPKRDRNGHIMRDVKTGEMLMVPDKKRKGQIFRQFIEQLRAAGYNVEYRVLNCADYGDPTTRERLFIMCRRHRKCVWPEPTHARIDGEKGQTRLFGKLHPWKPAKEIIDWSDLGENIFDRPKPLAPNTLRRIFIGLQKFSGLPFIITAGAQASGDKDVTRLAPFVFNNTGGKDPHVRGASVDEPVQAVTSGNHLFLTQPFLLNNRGGNDGYLCGSSVDEPLQAVTAHCPMELITPYLVEVNHGGDDARNHSIDDPLPTVTAKTSIGLVQPFVLGQQSGAAPRSVDDPVPTVAAKGAVELVQPFLVQYHGETSAKSARVRSVDVPMATVATENNAAVVQPFLVEYHCQSNAKSVDDPVSAVTSRAHHGLVQPFLVQYYNTGTASDIDDPVPTVTSKDHHALVQPYLVELYGTGKARSVDLPFPAVTASGNHHALVIPQLQGKALLIFMRMLSWRELALAQSFTPDYKFFGTIEEKKRQIGNAVPRLTAKALTKAVLSN